MSVPASFRFYRGADCGPTIIFRVALERNISVGNDPTCRQATHSAKNAIAVLASLIATHPCALSPGLTHFPDAGFQPGILCTLPSNIN